MRPANTTWCTVAEGGATIAEQLRYMDSSAQADFLRLREQHMRYEVLLRAVNDPATLEGSIFKRAVLRMTEFCRHMGYDDSIGILCQQVLPRLPFPQGFLLPVLCPGRVILEEGQEIQGCKRNER